MDWQARYYPPDVFQSLEQKIEAMIQSRTCEAAQIVREEIDAVGTPGLKTWAKNHARFVRSVESRNSARSCRHRIDVSGLNGPEEHGPFGRRLRHRIGKGEGRDRRIPRDLGAREAESQKEPLHSGRLP